MSDLTTTEAHVPSDPRHAAGWTRVDDAASSAVPSTPPSSVHASHPGRLGGRYTLQEPIGYGGMGQVYRARDEVLDRDVAVKLLDAAAFDQHDLTRASIAEARAAARLTHPGIVHVFDAGAQDGTSYVVMELVPGRPLQELVRERGALPPAEAVELAAQVGDALDAAHRQGVVHCDVKPQNILVMPDGRARLVDFGIARAATRTLPGGEIRGSAAYVAPEQVGGERVDGRADVYALRAVLYRLLTGRPPFQGQTPAAVVTQKLVAEPPPPRALNPRVGPELDAIVMRALAREPARRFADAAAMRDALRAVAGRGVSLSDAEMQVMPPLPARARRAPRTPMRSARRGRSWSRSSSLPSWPGSAWWRPSPGRGLRPGRPSGRSWRPLWSAIGSRSCRRCSSKPAWRRPTSRSARARWSRAPPARSSISSPNRVSQ